MNKSLKLFSAVAALAALAGCSDYLTGGDLSNDPNRPIAATNKQLLVGIEANVFGFLGGDPARTTGIYAQQFTGAQSQYLSNIQSYQITEQNTNDMDQGLYGGGGLVDIRKLEAGAIAVKDTAFLGIAQVYEGLLIGTGADLFGDIVYSQALGAPNPALDNQLTVYDSVQAVLSRAIVNLQKSGGTNLGPDIADLVYGGNTARYVAMAHTLKARFYMHTAEVRPAAYAQALAEAKLGIMSNAGNFNGQFFDASSQQNFYYQFEVIQGRTGYVIPNANFVSLLESRADPRRAEYFNSDASDISDSRLAPDFKQPFVTYDENTLIWAEAAYRTGDPVTALLKLNEERANHGIAAEPIGLVGNALLAEILTEKYIVDFQLGEEALNDYNRTCFPNLAPTGVVPGPIPARYYYGSTFRQTNTSVPQPGQGVNTLKNRDNPKNATADAVGGVCLGQ